LSGVLSELKPGFLQIVFSRIRRRVHDTRTQTEVGLLESGWYQRCMESEIFDSDSAPALAEYTPTHFEVLDSDFCSNSKVNYLSFWQCLNDRIRFSH